MSNPTVHETVVAVMLQIGKQISLDNILQFVQRQLYVDILFYSRNIVDRKFY